MGIGESFITAAIVIGGTMLWGLFCAMLLPKKVRKEVLGTVVQKPVSNNTKRSQQTQQKQGEDVSKTKPTPKAGVKRVTEKQSCPNWPSGCEKCLKASRCNSSKG